MQFLFIIFYSTLMVAAEIPHRPFYFVRHGMTEWNLLTKQHGQADIPLHAQGRKQAQELRKLCDILFITRFCSSTLSRAYETMQILNSSRKLPEYRYDDLKERGKGILEGITEQEWNTLSRDAIDDAMENKDLFEQRTKRVLHEILSEPGIPCIVAHSNNLRYIGKLTGCQIHNISHNVIWHFEPPRDGNGSWKMIELKLS